jgi:hypothetical protein
MNMEDPQIRLLFMGPFSWGQEADAKCIADAPEGKLSGVYLWANGSPERELVYYVGETGVSFAIRMKDHLVQELSGMYHIHDPALFRQGEKKCLWAGMYGKTAEPGGLMEFLGRLPELYPALSGFVHQMRFYLAPTNCDPRMRKRIEAALSSHFIGLREQGFDLQDDGVVYSPRKAHEKPQEITISSIRPIAGLPEKLVV